MQVGAGDDSVEVGGSQMDFIDGFDYAVKIMTELNFSPSEIASRQEFVRWLFWHPSLSEKARMICAEKFLVRYHAHPDWPKAAKEESFIWMEGVNMSLPPGGSRVSSSGSSLSPRRIARKRKPKSHSAKDKGQSQAKQKETSSREKSSSRDSRSPPEGCIPGTCDSRIAKHLTCRYERNGGDGSECAFSHTCPRCPNVNHSAANCGKI